MPRFFFDVHDGPTSITDQEGVDLPDRDSAEAFAAGLMSTLPAADGGARRVLIRGMGVGEAEDRLADKPDRTS